MTMMFVRLFPACFALVLCSTALAQSLLPTTNTDTRIIVFDASGSMAQSDFRRNTTDRIIIAQELLTGTYARLLENQDTVPTSTLVFGAEYSWSDERRRNGWSDPSDPRTLSHPICSDSAVKLNPAPVSGESVRFAQDLINRGELKPNGMTPIHVSLLQGLRSFDGEIDGKHLQFVLISDLEEPNCLPPGGNLCDQLLPDLSRINALGGTVSAIVFEAPTAGLLGKLDDCMGIISIPVPPDTDEDGISPIIEEAFDLLEIQPRFIAGGQNNLDPSGVEDTSRARLQFTEARSRVPLASGPSGAFRLPTGTYAVEGKIDQASFLQDATITGDGDLPITVEPGVLVISATDSSSSNIAVINTLEIMRANGRAVKTLSSYNTGAPINLANGEYVVTGTSANGQTVTGSVVLELGATRELSFMFGTPPAQPTDQRDVRINVTLSGPTLDVGGNWPPEITLSGPSGAQIGLTSNGYAGKLEPGTYTIDINSQQPHSLVFELEEGGRAYEVNLDVPAGWFTLTSPSGRSQSYELRDGSGLPLYRIDGSQIQHALPEGIYQIALLDRDGREIVRKFQVLLGVEVRIDDL